MFNQTPQVADISTLGLNDIVYCAECGKGTIVKCTEKPSVRINFEKCGLRWITQYSAELMGIQAL